MSRRQSEVYTHSHAPVVVAAHAARTAEEAAAFLIPRLEPDMRVLDVGCGPGSITAGLASYVSRVVGIDTATEVLTAARTRMATGSLSNVSLVAADAYDLPFPAASFDVVYGHQVLQHVADPIAVLREARRVLRPGGLVAVRDADYGTMTHHPHYPLLDRWLEIYHAVARANGGEPDAGRRLLAWVQAAGFEDLRASSTTWTYATPDERAGWADLWAHRIVLERFTSRAEAHGISDRLELERIGDAFCSWASEPAGWFAFIHGEVVAAKPTRSPTGEDVTK
jgi:SAM-dependent methyltransferase